MKIKSCVLAVTIGMSCMGYGQDKTPVGSTQPPAIKLQEIEMLKLQNFALQYQVLQKQAQDLQGALAKTESEGNEYIAALSHKYNATFDGKTGTFVANPVVKKDEVKPAMPKK